MGDIDVVKIKSQHILSFLNYMRTDSTGIFGFNDKYPLCVEPAKLSNTVAQEGLH